MGNEPAALFYKRCAETVIREMARYLVSQFPTNAAAAINALHLCRCPCGKAATGMPAPFMCSLARVTMYLFYSRGEDKAEVVEWMSQAAVVSGQQ